MMAPLDGLFEGQKENGDLVRFDGTPSWIVWPPSSTARICRIKRSGAPPSQGFTLRDTLHNSAVVSVTTFALFFLHLSIIAYYKDFLQRAQVFEPETIY
jgi:hypothetical protein